MILSSLSTWMVKTAQKEKNIFPNMGTKISILYLLKTIVLGAPEWVRWCSRTADSLLLPLPPLLLLFVLSLSLCVKERNKTFKKNCL